VNKAIQRTVCRTPTPGKKPTAIPTWKYELVREAILASAPGSEPGVPANDLPEAVRGRLRAEDLEDLGSVVWHTTTVRLNMEVEGELRRVRGSRPLRVVRA